MPTMDEDMIPSPEELHKRYVMAGHVQPITDDCRQAIVLWERTVRDSVLRDQPAPNVTPHRWRMDDERRSITHRFEIAGEDRIKSYLTMSLYDDTTLGELFLTVDKQGSFASGIMDALTYTISVALQHGVPLEVFTRHFSNTMFSPAGLVRGAPMELRGFARSVLDYLGRYLTYKFPNGKLRKEPRPKEAPKEAKEPVAASSDVIPLPEKPKARTTMLARWSGRRATRHDNRRFLIQEKSNG